jgi:hypothetical protein
MRIQFPFEIAGMATVILCSTMPVIAQDISKASIEKANEQARLSLQVLQHIVTPEIGFSSKEEARGAQLGTPLRVFMVGLDKLKDFQASVEPNSLLNDTHQLIYPVSVNGEHRSSVTLHEINGEWQIGSFGKPYFSKSLGQVLDAQLAETKYPAAEFFVVEIPALRTFFLARHHGSDLLLTPLHDDTAHKLTAGRTVDAKEVFGSLAPSARERKTGPYMSD